MKMKKHQLLTQKSYYIARVNRVKLGSPLRTEVARKFLIRKLTDIHDVCTALDAQPDVEENAFQDAVSDIVERYEKGTQEMFRKDYPCCGKDLFDIFYTQHFHPIHAKNVEFITNFVYLQSSSSMPDDIKKSTFFTLCLTAFELALFDVERSFRRINGSFEVIEQKVKIARETPQAFISYAHADEAYVNELLKHVAPLQRANKLGVWHDRSIVPGCRWAENIDAAMRGSNIFIALLSPDFFASKYCYEIELDLALQLSAIGRMHIIPVIIRPVAASMLPVFEFQILPRDAKPVSTYANQDMAWAEVMNEIHKVCNSLIPAP